MTEDTAEETMIPSLQDSLKRLNETQTARRNRGRGLQQAPLMYADPSPSTGCNYNVVNVVVSTEGGEICSPPCGAGEPCPMPIKGWAWNTTAKPACTIPAKAGGPPTNCVLECVPGLTTCPAEGLPGGAYCTCATGDQPCEGHVGICVFYS